MVEVYCGDCRDLVPGLGLFDFIFADPPFNIGQSYVGYLDSREDFERFTFQWIRVCWEACDGVLALHGNDRLVELYLEAAGHFGMRRVGWVLWTYRFGICWVDGGCLVATILGMGVVRFGS